jgi:hypothetical protein
VTDCDDSLCVLRYCDGNHQCDYYDVLPCGTPDLGDGDTCMGGDALCDGAGDCDYDVAECDGAYAWTGNYTCGPAEVSEECYTVCSDDDQCNIGFYCDSGACVGLLENGESVCTQNSDCLSEYCNTVTGVCCDGGYCCDDNAQCFPYDCDIGGDWNCGFTCDEGFGDDDTLCTPLGDFHCDNAQCYEDLFNGEAYCDEDTDCLSNHCDLVSGVCCDSGPCCQDDIDCGGFICDTDYNCVTDCSPLAIEDDGLCAADYHCDGSSCLPDIINGGSGCDEDSDCVSGHCTPSTGVCCTDVPGDCCNSPSQCEDGNDCTTNYCSGTFHCNFVPKADNEPCFDGDFCNGPERCQSGICVDSPDPCDGDTFCMDVGCDETNDECTYTAINQGQPCSESLFCLGDVMMECNDFGVCVDPGTGTPPCTGDTGNECTDYWCNEETDNCDEVDLSDGVPCDDGDPCNGENDGCELGTCVGTENPCTDDDPCTLDNCTDGGGFPVCGSHDPIPDGGACENGLCVGDDARCYNDTCVPGPARPCWDNDLCTIESCTVDMWGDPQCADVGAPTPVTLTCGSTANLEISDFGGVEYYAYSGSCVGTFWGKEAILTLDVPVAGNVTLVASGAAPPQSVTILRLTDECDPSSCTDSGVDSLTVTLPVGPAMFIVEGEAGNTPHALDIDVTCP